MAGGTSSLPKYLLACACAHLPTQRIMTQYEDEAGKIANGDAWEHGYWAGTLTFLRLIQGLSVTNGYLDEDGEEITTAMIRENAQEEYMYPMLDS